MHSTTSHTRIVVLTGVSSGLGAALVPRLIDAGCTVAGCARREAAIEALRSRYGGDHLFDVVDVSDDQAVAAWAERVIAEVGPPDLLINNAALINEPKPLWEIPADAFQQLLDINIAGAANTIRHFAPAMIARGSGVIVNLSSGWGRSVSAEVAPYCATKWAIEGLSKALAEELPPGVACVPLNPGVIDTPMLRTAWGESAGGFPTADQWAKKAADYLLRITAADNGRSLTVGD